MASNLGTLSPITVHGQMFPSPQLLTNIPMLHWMLGDVLEDWLRAVEPYQTRVDEAQTEPEKLCAVGTGFMELQPALLKCLFSYAFFFVSADNAYHNFYKDLNRANHLSGLKLKHHKPPKMTPFLTKITTIRDISIAHIPSEKAEPIDAFAAMSWQPMSLSYPNGGQPDLEKLIFVPGRFRGTDATGQVKQSMDLEVSGIETPHTEHCLPYLERYDEVCCEYLRALHDAVDPNQKGLAMSSW